MGSAPSPIDTDVLAAALERRIARVTQLVRAGAHTRRSVAALLTLRRLEDEGPLRITGLAAAELVAQPTMTGLVRRLEDEGLVARTPDPQDARAVRIALTDAGRAELAGVRAARAAALRDRLEHMDPEACAALHAALGPLDDLLTTEPRT
jgi:DNA-binding MarR family transcriptional regulator